jgi:hypothetical protein
MQLNGTIRIRPAGNSSTADNMNTRHIVSTGTFDDVRARLDAQVSNGHQSLFVRSA